MGSFDFPNIAYSRTLYNGISLIMFIRGFAVMKPIYQSKTVWFNLAMTIVMAVPVIASAYKGISPEQAVFIDSVAALITGLGNILLRVWFTDTPIDTPKSRAKLCADASGDVLSAEDCAKRLDGLG